MKPEKFKEFMDTINKVSNSNPNNTISIALTILAQELVETQERVYKLEQDKNEIPNTN